MCFTRPNLAQTGELGSLPVGRRGVVLSQGDDGASLKLQQLSERCLIT